MFGIPGAIHPVLDGTHVPEHEAPDRRSVPRGEHGQCALPDAPSSQVSLKPGEHGQCALPDAPPSQVSLKPGEHGQCALPDAPSSQVSLKPGTQRDPLEKVVVTTCSNW